MREREINKVSVRPGHPIVKIFENVKTNSQEIFETSLANLFVVIASLLVC